MSLLLVFLLAGCFPRASESSKVSTVVEKNGVAVTLTRQDASLSTIDLLRIEISAEAPQGSEFHFPNNQADYGDFSYFESHETSLKLNSRNNVIQNFSLVVEPALPGSHKFPALTILYGDQEVKTEPFVVDVSSVLGENDKEVKDVVGLTSETVFSSFLLAFIPLFY
ncbi:MAG: hypothetical protein NE330_23620, partial [Lentisphaeraceae bacterium]|nr:hypothetical protein [Lentisphaeraceae bacterium]